MAKEGKGSPFPKQSVSLVDTSGRNKAIYCIGKQRGSPQKPLGSPYLEGIHPDITKTEHKQFDPLGFGFEYSKKNKQTKNPMLFAIYLLGSSEVGFTSIW